MMARMTPVSLHFSDVPTGWKKNLYRQTTVGYWFCMFVTNSLSRRTVLQINLRQLHSVPCATRYASLPAPTSICSFISKLKTRLLSLTYQISSVPWCRGWPQLQNVHKRCHSLVTSTTSCTNLLYTRTIQCKECVLRSLRPRLLRLTSKHHCRIDMQTEQWSSLWTSQFPHRLSHQTNQAPHVLARIH